MLERLTNWIAAALVCAALGCSSEPLDDANTGTVAIKLMTDNPDGTRYRLNGKFEIEGEGTDILLDASGDESVLRHTLPSGSYTIKLVEGWYIEQDNIGQWQAVETALASPNPQTLLIARGTETLSHWQFLLRAAEGEVLISFDVAMPAALLGFVAVDPSDPGAASGVPLYDFETYFLLTPGETGERVTNTGSIKFRDYGYGSTSFYWNGETHPFLGGLSGKFRINANYSITDGTALVLTSVTWSGLKVVGHGSAPAPAYTGLGVMEEEGWTFARSEVFAPAAISLDDAEAVTNEMEELRAGGPPVLTADGFPTETIEFSTLTRSSRYITDAAGARFDSSGRALFTCRPSLPASH